MPPDLTKSSPPRSRRRKELQEFEMDTSQIREMEFKRSRGELSCAECRRLKIKCDKQVPCQSCQRRGCASLCPNGSLATGDGTRYVLAATEHLHRQVAKMRDHIYQLEDALATAQAHTSAEKHPLLVEGHREFDLDFVADADDARGGSEPAHGMMAPVGTLSIGDNGTQHFFGPSGGPESALNADNDAAPAITQGGPSLSELPEPLRRSSAAFPFSPLNSIEAIINLLREHLPTRDQAYALANIFLDRVAWLVPMVSRAQLNDELLPLAFGRSSDAGRSAGGYCCPHTFALLFSVFALGALHDGSKQSGQDDGDYYQQFCRAALGSQSIFEKPTIMAVQALQLMSVYSGMRGEESTSQMETSLSYVRLAAQISQTMGLHIDGTKWNLRTAVVQRRRLVFWNIFAADVCQSLLTGRPPTLNRAYINCQLPDGAAGDNGCFLFARNVMSEVCALALATEIPSYSVVAELDRKIQDFPIHPEAATLATEEIPPSSGPSHDGLSPSLSMQRFVMSIMREVILIYLHRSFFVQALLDYPDNPFKSPYNLSFTSSFRAACTISKVMRHQFALHPRMCALVSQLWTFALSSALIFGTVVTHGPSCPLAHSAMGELVRSCELFSKAAKVGGRAAKALPIVLRLHDKAQAAMTAVREGKPPPPLADAPDDQTDELTIFATGAKFVSSQRFSATRQSQDGLVLSRPQSHLPSSPTQSRHSTYDAHAAPAQSPVQYPSWATLAPGHTGLYRPPADRAYPHDAAHQSPPLSHDRRSSAYYGLWNQSPPAVSASAAHFAQYSSSATQTAAVTTPTSDDYAPQHGLQPLLYPSYYTSPRQQGTVFAQPYSGAHSYFPQGPSESSAASSNLQDFGLPAQPGGWDAGWTSNARDSGSFKRPG